MNTDLWDYDYFLVHGDFASWSILYEQYYPYVYNYIRKKLRSNFNDEAVEDIAMDAFSICFRKRETFEGRSAFSTWICGVANKLMLHALHKLPHYRNPAYDDKFTPEYAISYYKSPEEIIIKKEQMEYIRYIFKSLSYKQRLLIECYILNEKTPREIMRETYTNYCKRMEELQIAVKIFYSRYTFLYLYGPNG